ncbi:beta-propeller fold lactonase family protein [Streptomyces sp. NPDC127178]|uniref:beta-propeller fold lactonase family protein n=1 Tax=unclassified Streptomyces TaxID=2593676 RepID=UPI003638183F
MATLIGIIVPIAVAAPASATSPQPLNVAWVANLRPNSSTGTLTAIDTQTNTILESVPVGGDPTAVAVSPDGSHVYVTNSAWQPPGTPGSVTVLNIPDSTRTTVPVGQDPQGVAITKDHVYVANARSNDVSVIDPTTDKVTQTIHVGAWPTKMAVSPDGHTLYVANELGGSVSVINTATDTVTATIHGLSKPEGVAVAPDVRVVYVTDSVQDRVTLIDPETNTISDIRDAGGAGPNSVAIGNDNNGNAYVTDGGSQVLAVLPLLDNTVAHKITIGKWAAGLALTPNDSTAYVTNSGDNTVSVIDTATNAVTDTIKDKAFDAPQGVAVGPWPIPNHARVSGPWHERGPDLGV